MILKLIILFFIIWAGLRIYQLIKDKNQEATVQKKVQDMVSCHKCGIHIPVEEALVDNGEYYCCKDHVSRD